MTAGPRAPAQDHGRRPASSFENEIKRARRYERGLVLKAAFVLALVAAAMLAHVYLFS